MKGLEDQLARLRQAQAASGQQAAALRERLRRAAERRRARPDVFADLRRGGETFPGLWGREFGVMCRCWAMTGPCSMTTVLSATLHLTVLHKRHVP